MENETLQLYRREIQRRFEEAMEPFHALAYATDQNNLLKNKTLPPEENEKMNLWLNKNYPEFIPCYLSFTIRDPDYFDNSALSEQVCQNFTCYKWWRMINVKCANKLQYIKNDTKILTMKNFILFTEFLMKLHTSPSSSAGLERIFSTFKFIWSPLRNTLGPEKVDKLVKIHKSLNKNNIYDDYVYDNNVDIFQIEDQEQSDSDC